MEKGFRLTQEQKLQQRLAPLQVRYVRMLEMSGPEFEEEVRNALDEMPALEAAPDENTSAPSDSATEDGGYFTESAHDIQVADYRSEDDIPDYLHSHGYATRQDLPEDYTEPIVQASGDSMLEALTKQLSVINVSDRDMLIARYIIGNLDDNGYLDRNINAIADDISISESVDISADEVNNVWQMVRDLDPAGIAASDLRDCLLLQLRRLPRNVTSVTAIEIIRDYFDLFSKKHFSRIASVLSLSDTELRDAITLISHLNPKPASLLENTPGGTAPVVVPDFHVEVDSDGDITLSLLNRVPELSIEATFAADAPLPEASKKNTDAARVFLKQKRDEANDFIRLVEMRQRTLFTVMSAIVKMQRPFFLSDDEADIQPMVLRDLAELTGLDLSVISRATQEKYVLTRSGIYPLKMFFNERRHKNTPAAVISASREGRQQSASSPPAPEVDDSSTPRVQAAIRDIIAEEDKRHPLSDEQITRILNSSGFGIARRTVAKYREKLGFPVGRLRRAL